MRPEIDGERLTKEQLCFDRHHYPHKPHFYHYENTPMLNIDFSEIVKIENFQQKIFDIFLIFAQNIDCGYTLEPPRQGGSNEYPQSMFWSKNKKNRYTPAYPSFTIVGYEGVFISWCI